MSAALEFSPKGMAAALEISVESFEIFRRSNKFPAPDTVRNKEPRWSVEQFFEIAHRVYPGKTLDALVLVMEALLRAEHAEGWHDDN